MLRIATPELSGTVPSAFSPSKIVVVPVGVAPLPANVNVNVTLSPKYATAREVVPFTVTELLWTVTLTEPAEGVL
jgi:hypothetical protein